MSQTDTPQMLPKTQLQVEELPVFVPDLDAMHEYQFVGLNNRDSRSRPFHLLRTTLSKSLKEKNYRLVGITSATPAAGKSFLSMNLAASLAQVADDPVFLVDLDLRRASLAKDIGLVVDRGISDFLNGDVSDLSSIGVRIEGSELTLFPTKRVSNNTAELVSGTNFDYLIDSLRSQTGQSIILFDLPPAFANDDTMLILEKLDSYIMVVDSGKTNRRQVQEMLSILNPVPCAGTILNRYRGGFGDSYGYGYSASSYKKYYD
ncbi:CpsD/CapB family tyrosine-protein kinase [uncultured Parasphingorhabdus sp.]|uniref:CpsD/CapB family tyrosine-protein kinase n=1 Tax=uncultured Parasphingorhabdus sp. TaxID=2709694 RepID=UPI0030DAA884|tara:strand:+ start:87200 stop:87982 length:783 start_codon:yes stop_codon:yes gene_type:complete